MYVFGCEDHRQTLRKYGRRSALVIYSSFDNRENLQNEGNEVGNKVQPSSEVNVPENIERHFIVSEINGYLGPQNIDC